MLPFNIVGSPDRKFMFISQVEKKSKAEEVGLKRGDQILEVNGQSFEHVNHSRALDILRGSTHLSITVKSNLFCKNMNNQSTSDEQNRTFEEEFEPSELYLFIYLFKINTSVFPMLIILHQFRFWFCWLKKKNW